MIAIAIASLVAFAIGGACFLVLRKLTLARAAFEDLNAWTELEHQTTGPLERLLDPAEFEHLLQRGMRREQVRQLRARRRRLFRMYLRRLTEEFNTAHELLQMVLVTAGEDRPDLVRELNQQRLLFYRGLIAVELRLTLNALGFEAAPTLELLRPLERLHLEFCRFLPAGAL